MMLLLDLGNSAVKWGLANDSTLTASGRVEHAGSGWQAVLAQAWLSLSAPDRVIVANVAGPEIAGQIDELVRQCWQLSPQYLHTTAAARGVRNAYARPSRLGIDRWAALVAAWHRDRTDVSVIDCGTAITVDRVTADGRHLGGLILPGVGVLQNALLAAAARLPDALPDEPAVPFATDSAAALVSGALLTAAAALERALQSMDDTAGQMARVVLSGGDAGRMEPLLGRPVELRPHLVLEGLALLAAAD